MLVSSVNDHKTDDSATDTPPQSVSGPPTTHEDAVKDEADSVVGELKKSINVEKLVGKTDTTIFFTCI